MSIFPKCWQLLYTSTMLEEFMTKSVSGQCVICLSRINYGKRNVRLPCEHIYHHICLATWMLVRFNCPLCREMIMA